MGRIIPFKYKKFYELEETNEQWAERMKNKEKEWIIDFDEGIRNNAHSIPEKIAVFIWEHTGKTGYVYIEDSVKGVFYSIYGLMTLIISLLFITLLIVGCLKLGNYIYQL